MAEIKEGNPREPLLEWPLLRSITIRRSLIALPPQPPFPPPNLSFNFGPHPDTNEDWCCLERWKPQFPAFSVLPCRANSHRAVASQCKLETERDTLVSVLERGLEAAEEGGGGSNWIAAGGRVVVLLNTCWMYFC